MFEVQIELAMDLIRRSRIGATGGFASMPEHERITYSELTAWFSASRNLVLDTFGADSQELASYDFTVKRYNEIHDAARARGDREYDFWARIDHFYLVVGQLRELEARYVAIREERRPAPGETIMGNKYVFGDISGSIVNVDSELERVKQSLGSAAVDKANKKTLEELLDQLKSELHNMPLNKREEAEAIADSAKVFVQAGTKTKPNKTTLQITADGLRKAAESVADVMPAVLAVASSIVKTVLNLSGVPTP